MRVFRTQNAPSTAARTAAAIAPSRIDHKSGAPARKSSAAVYAPPA